jgi:hypothetical protein
MRSTGVLLSIGALLASALAVGCYEERVPPRQPAASTVVVSHSQPAVANTQPAPQPTAAPVINQVNAAPPANTAPAPATTVVQPVVVPARP